MFISCLYYLQFINEDQGEQMKEKMNLMGNNNRI